MTDKEFLGEFTDVRKGPNGFELRVRRITWPLPHAPESSWHTARILPPDARPAEIEVARQKLLEDPKHFRVCSECHERNPRGWMHDDAICQACAERNHGVVY